MAQSIDGGRFNRPAKLVGDESGNYYPLRVNSDGELVVSSTAAVVDQYATSDVDDAGTVKYYGFINSTGAWYIHREDTGASPKTHRYTRGDSGYNFSNRASLTYDRYDVVFPP